MSERWVEQRTEDGFVVTVTLSKFRYFVDYVTEKLLGPRYIYRGHRRMDWRLESTFDRQLAKDLPLSVARNLAGKHLKTFKESSLGRRGDRPPKLNDDHWWALGQHFGLATPLLDWTRSPFIAAYFAFHEEDESTGKRVVFALSLPGISSLGRILEKNGLAKEVVKIITPQMDGNPRLISQQGLFTKLPLGCELESWSRGILPNATGNDMLIRMEIPSTEREEALQLLDAMNISHFTLYPDLTGASLHANRLTRRKAQSRIQPLSRQQEEPLRSDNPETESW